MTRPIVFVFPLLLLLSGCGSADSNPLSAIGLMESKKEPIVYSPRPPLVIPPEEQRSLLPTPQGYASAPPPPPAQQQVQDVAVAPPPSYDTQAPQPANAPPAEDTPWWVRIFGS